MNVLAVVAHPDDELLGCGGTLRRLALDGHAIYTCVLCASADARYERPDSVRLANAVLASERAIGISDSIKYEFPNIQFNVVPHLEIVKAIEEAIVRFRPEWIFTHHIGDVNIDHKVCHEATMAAAMLPQRLSRALPVTMIRKILTFEVLSSTDWGSTTAPAFQPNCFFNIVDTIDDKMAALRVFDGALKPFPHSRSEENLRALAQLRGGQIGIPAAEAFVVVREINV
jgi:LmbE family N-acetylglucosaminyl deacetylase